MTVSAKHLLYIPTHRPCGDIIEQSAKEVKWAEEAAQLPTALAVIEHGLPHDHSKAHRRILEHLCEQGFQSPVLHITRTAAHNYILRLMQACTLPDEDRRRIQALLLPTALSYGAAPNLAYLIGSSLGCDTIHRRDSDVYLDRSRPDLLPVELELAGIGKCLRDVTVDVDDVGPNPPVDVERPVKLIGTTTFGCPTFDRRDLFEAGFEFALAFQRLGRPTSSLDEVRAELAFFLVEEPRVRYVTDFLQVDVDGRVEMEACAIYEGFRLLPEMPAIEILGTDYMVKDILWQLHEPVVFHSRKLEHRYDPLRAAWSDIRSVTAYVLRDVRYLQMGRVWAAHNETIEGIWPELIRDGDFDATRYASSFRRALGEAKSEVERVRLGAVEVYHAASQATTGRLSERLWQIATAIESTGISLDNDVTTAVDDFTFLVERWPTMMESASHTGLEDQVVVANARSYRT